MKFFLLQSLFLLSASSVMATEVPFINLSTEVTESTLEIVTVGDTIHGSINSAIKYSLSVVEEDPLVSYVATWKGQNDSVTTTDIEQINAVSKHLPAGLYSLKIKGFRERKIADDTSEYDTIVISSNVVKLWNTPRVEAVSFGTGTSVSPTVRWSETKVPVEFFHEGGNTSGWKTEALISTSGVVSKIPEGVVESTLTSDSKSNYTIVYNAWNYAPDNKTIWLSYSKECYYTIWAMPSVTKETGLPDTLYRYHSNIVKISPIINGGDSDNWTFKWLKSSSFYSSEKDIDIIAESNSTSKKTIEYTLVSTNSPDGINIPFRDTIKYVLTGYPTPSAIVYPTKNSTATKTTLFYPNTEELYCEAKFGNEAGWTYKWNGQSSSKDNRYTYVPSVENGTETVTVVAHNELPDAQASCDITMTYSFRVWPKPSVSKELGLPNTIYRYHGNIVKISPIINGGDPDNWTFKWLKSSSFYSSEKDIDIIAESNSTSKKTIEYTLVSTNAPNGISIPYRDTIKYILTGYPTPSAIVSPTKNSTVTKTTLFYPNTEELYCKASLGNPDGWTYKWNEQTFSTNNKYSFSPSIENGTETVTVVAHNELPDAQASYDTTMTYDYRIWPTPSVALSYKKDILNDSSIIVTVNPVGGDPDAWFYSWNGSPEGKDNVYRNIAFTSKTDGIVQQSIVLRAYNRPEGAKYESGAKNVYINIYPNPNSRKVTSDYQETCGGRDVNVGLEYHGGNPNGWTLNFSEQDAELSSDRLFSYIAINDGDNIENHTIVSTLKNECGNEVWFEKKDTFVIVVYPKPEVEVDFKTVSNHYFDIPLTLSSAVKGGDKDQWTFKWTLADSIVGETSSLCFEKPQSEGSFLYKLLVENTHDGQEWFSKTYVALLRFYSRGNANVVDGYKDAIYHEWNTNFQSKIEGGFPTGWTFKWYDEKGNLIENQDSSFLKIPVFNAGNSINDVIYSLVCENQIDGIVGSTTTLKYPFHIYPKVIEPRQIEGDENLKRVRDIDQETLSIALGKNGNIDGWLYDWNGSGFEKNVDTCAVIYGQIQSDVKSFKDIEYFVNWKNVSPLDPSEVWAEGTFFYPVRVYNTPARPDIVQKGTGNSAIYIAMNLPIEDDLLFNDQYAYTFQFGQGLNDEVEGEEVSHRWHRYDSNPNRPWVRSCWHYEDFDCVSDCSYLDGSTRSATSINLLSMDSYQLLPVYTISGILVGRVSSDATIDEIKQRLILAPGVYAILTKEGKKKVMIK